MRNTIINRRFKYTNDNLTVVLIGINIVVFGLTYFLFPRLVYTLAMIPSEILYHHTYWQFVTYMFTHGSVSHLLFNMFALYIFGSACERMVGSREFLLFYLLTGVLSGVASYFAFYFANNNAVLLGASGAIYAVMLLFSVLYPRAQVYVFGLIPMSAPVLVIVYFFIEFFSQFALNDGVSHMTHLFGLLFAFLYILIRMRINPFKAWSGR